MDIPNLELDEWIEVLKPYQRKIVIELVDKYGLEEAIDRWIVSSGPINTVKFGGNKDSSKHKFTELYKIEINKFLCGHPDYLEYRAEFSKHNEAIKLGIVSTITSIISPKLGVAGTVLAPLIVLSLSLFGKMGMNAYCSTITFD